MRVGESHSNQTGIELAAAMAKKKTQKKSFPAGLTNEARKRNLSDLKNYASVTSKMRKECPLVSLSGAKAP